MRTLVPLLCLLAAPVAAQEICPAPRPSEVPPCMVGAWVGTSNLAERMAPIFAPMPAAVRRQVMASMPGETFMAIYEDGFWVNAPHAGEIDFTALGGSAPKVEFLSTPCHGWLSVAPGGEVDVCVNPDAGVAFFTMSLPDGSTMPGMTPGARAGDFAPVMRATCEGDTMVVESLFPAPVGAVTYTFHRVPDTVIPDAAAELHANRLDR